MLKKHHPNRSIDEFVGQTTEAMRKQFRHLFPAAKQRSAIERASMKVA